MFHVEQRGKWACGSRCRCGDEVVVSPPRSVPAQVQVQACSCQTSNRQKHSVAAPRAERARWARRERKKPSPQPVGAPRLTAVTTAGKVEHLSNIALTAQKLVVGAQK